MSTNSLNNPDSNQDLLVLILKAHLVDWFHRKRLDNSWFVVQIHIIVVFTHTQKSDIWKLIFASQCKIYFFFLFACVYRNFSRTLAIAIQFALLFALFQNYCDNLLSAVCVNPLVNKKLILSIPQCITQCKHPVLDWISFHLILRWA